MKNLFAMAICFTLSCLLTGSIKRINETNKERLTFSNDMPFKEIIRVNSNNATTVKLTDLGTLENVDSFSYPTTNVIHSVPQEYLLLDLTISGTSKYCVESTGAGSTYIDTTKGQTTNITYKQ